MTENELCGASCTASFTDGCYYVVPQFQVPARVFCEASAGGFVEVWHLIILFCTSCRRRLAKVICQSTFLTHNFRGRLQPWKHILPSTFKMGETLPMGWICCMQKSILCVYMKSMNVVFLLDGHYGEQELAVTHV